MIRYIIVNTEGIITGESLLKDYVSNQFMIEVSSSFSTKEKKYDTILQQWVDYIEPIEATFEYTKLEFLNLFTDEELGEFLDIDALPVEAKKPLRVALSKFEAAQHINIKDAQTIQLVNGLVALNILTPERSQAILGW